MKRVVLAGIAALCLAAIAPQSWAIPFNLDHRAPVTEPAVLDAGTFQITPFGDADGEQYDFDAYNVWDTTTNCNADGADCSTGWRWRFLLLHDPEGDPSDPANVVAGFSTGLYSTAVGALNAAKAAGPFQFSLASAATVYFYYRDSHYSDNLGGISLELTQVEVPPPNGNVPEPGILALLGAALAGAGLRRRRRTA